MSKDRCKIVDQNDISSIELINRPYMEKNLRWIPQREKVRIMASSTQEEDKS